MAVNAAYLKSIQDLDKIAEVEFVLTPSRQHSGKGFIDTLFLELSDDIKSERARLEMAESILGMIGHSPLRQDIFYRHIDIIPAEQQQNMFFKVDDGQLYGANIQDAAKAANAVIEKVDGIVDHPLSLCINVSVDGLDYFKHCKARKEGRLYVIEQQVEPPTPHFYNTNCEDTHGIKHWLLALGKSLN